MPSPPKPVCRPSADGSVGRRLPSVLADGPGCAATEFARTAYNAVVADALATAVLACVLHAAVLTTFILLRHLCDLQARRYSYSCNLKRGAITAVEADPRAIMVAAGQGKQWGKSG